MTRLLTLFALLLACALPARGEEIVAGLSRDSIGITASFDGSEILIYGAVKRNAPAAQTGELHVIVTLEGPSSAVTIRRKSREMGIWVNTDSLTVGAAPSYYAIASSGPMHLILDPVEDVQQRISIPLAVRAFAGPVQMSDVRPFTQALLRIREEEGLYKEEEGAVRIVEDTLFRADFELPANLIEGDYKTRIFLVRDSHIIDRYQSAIYVRRVGLERWLYVLAQDYAPLYALLSLALAVFSGWAAAAVFRLIRS
ncbi:TIGR02186 family protein [Pseudothioclava arenosa]|uniref:TIGR02186 family protein n=1 Tax=Pseudothioclava arenosa TaxID=1795308 RepID=A0A2A4CU41_9RHOB|nr:TIGR02186 family protein [Pseudothioclava arenosa]PCD77782.1 hypothetical protein CLN94_00190 [Pseudothioclava arenosa]